MSDELHVSSLVVHGRPDRLDGIRASLLRMPGVEIHATGPTGKMVVTLETFSEAEIVNRLTEISLLDGVLSAALVFHHFEQQRNPD